MIELNNPTLLEVNETLLNSIAKTISNKDIELIVTSNEEIRAINKKYRDIDKPTDVLSFAYEDMPMAPLGSIVVSYEYIESKAHELGHTISDELALLFIHGLLHLVGFDHENDLGEMREEEKRLIKKFNLPESLIVRTQG